MITILNYVLLNLTPAILLTSAVFIYIYRNALILIDEVNRGVYGSRPLKSLLELATFLLVFAMSGVFLYDFQATNMQVIAITLAAFFISYVFLNRLTMHYTKVGSVILAILAISAIYIAIAMKLNYI